MTEALIAEGAERFWAAAGGRTEDPRDFGALIPSALPLAVVSLPAVSIARIERWLASHGASVCLNRSDRRLRGGLIAHRGHGFAFVDGSDPDDERRFTLAHEVAHFLIDYLHPRERAIQILGDNVADVLDGFRPPFPRERTAAVLAACPLGVFVDLLDRDGDRGAAVDARETRADRLASELLAPADELTAAGLRGARADELARCLRERYGLPAAPADVYARCLRREWGQGPSFLDWLSS